MYSIILLSGGKGKRMLKDVPKQYLLLAGKPIIMHSIERLDKIADINEIIVVCEKEYISNIQLMLQQYNIEMKAIYVQAGATRQESVYNGLQFVHNTHVIIHEAARPFATEDDFLRLIHTECDNAILGYHIPFTVIKGQAGITDTLNRSELINVQLPQKFNVSLLMKAHQQAILDKKIFTEDASLVFNYYKSDIRIVEGTEYNLKITEPIDLLTGEIIYKEYIVGRN